MDKMLNVVRSLSDDHLEILDRLATYEKLSLASRYQDGLRRKLREVGAIAYCGKPKRWQITDDGLRLRNYLKDWLYA